MTSGWWFLLVFWLLTWAPRAVLPQDGPGLARGGARGYLTTPPELSRIARHTAQGKAPYAAAVAQVLSYANKAWQFPLVAHTSCESVHDPAWIHHQGGAPIVYAKALAYHLTGEKAYARDVQAILARVMTEVVTIVPHSQQCQLNFAWGIPEYVYAADLIEDVWQDLSCRGPLSTAHGEHQHGEGKCKWLFQNWLIKNPYYIVSYTDPGSMNNWSTAGANATGVIADYLWDRPAVLLEHRNPWWVAGGRSVFLTPAQAFASIRQRTLAGMNGYAVHYGSSKSCDLLEQSTAQLPALGPPVKSQITPEGIIPEDAKRQEYCNIKQYNGTYQNYPQLNLGHLVSYCELLWRRGDASCFDNVDNTDVPQFTFPGPRGQTLTTHLYPGRGSLERAINAIVLDSYTPWKKDGGLEIAYRYYFRHKRLPNTALHRWFANLDRRPFGPSQDACFTTLTHGFTPGEVPESPPTASPPAGAVPGSGTP